MVPYDTYIRHRQKGLSDCWSVSRVGSLRHVVGMRREVFDCCPWAVKSLYSALEASKTAWQARRRRLADTHRWTLAEIEESTALIGED